MRRPDAAGAGDGWLAVHVRRTKHQRPDRACIVPNVRSAHDARAIVVAAKYDGRRDVVQVQLYDR